MKSNVQDIEYYILNIAFQLIFSIFLLHLVLQAYVMGNILFLETTISSGPPHTTGHHSLEVFGNVLDQLGRMEVLLSFFTASLHLSAVKIHQIQPSWSHSGSEFFVHL